MGLLRGLNGNPICVEHLKQYRHVVITQWKSHYHCFMYFRYVNIISAFIKFTIQQFLKGIWGGSQKNHRASNKWSWCSESHDLKACGLARQSSASRVYWWPPFLILMQLAVSQLPALSISFLCSHSWLCLGLGMRPDQVWFVLTWGFPCVSLAHTHAHCLNRAASWNRRRPDFCAWGGAGWEQEGGLSLEGGRGLGVCAGKEGIVSFRASSLLLSSVRWEEDLTGKGAAWPSGEPRGKSEAHRAWCVLELWAVWCDGASVWGEALEGGEGGEGARTGLGQPVCRVLQGRAQESGLSCWPSRSFRRVTWSECILETLLLLLSV